MVVYFWSNQELHIHMFSGFYVMFKNSQGVLPLFLLRSNSQTVTSFDLKLSYAVR